MCRPIARPSRRSLGSPAAPPSSAPTPQALEAVYERLGTSIGYQEEKREVTAWFAAGGLVLLVLAGSLSALWFNRLP